MEDNDIVKIAAVGFITIVVAPVVIGVVANVVGSTCVGITNTYNKVKFNKKIKKGLKNGSIVEVDGKYYNAVIENVEEA